MVSDFGRLALITPALFSHPSTYPSGEKREKASPISF
jgi:hypothetical protein